MNMKRIASFGLLVLSALLAPTSVRCSMQAAWPYRAMLGYGALASSFSFAGGVLAYGGSLLHDALAAGVDTATVVGDGCALGMLALLFAAPGACACWCLVRGGRSVADPEAVFLLHWQRGSINRAA